jgi:hypothetical protein
MPPSTTDNQTLAARRDGGDARGDAQTNVAAATQLLHHGIDLLGFRSLRVENGFGVVEEQNHFP